MLENKDIKKEVKKQDWSIIQEWKDFITSFKDKYYSVLKYFWYYIVVLLWIFILLNLTDFFSYKTIFNNSQIVLNNGLNLVKQYNNSVSNNELEDVLKAKYWVTAKALKDFFNSTDVVGYFCVDSEWTIKKIDTNKITANISWISVDTPNPDMINKIMWLVIATDYAYCWRDSNIFKVYYNKIYSWNVLTDVLNINVKGSNEDNLYKFYKFLKYYYPSANETLKQMWQTIVVYYPDLAKKLWLNNWTSVNNTSTINSIDMVLYSPWTLLVNTTVNLFTDEITNSKIWYDWNDWTKFFSKLSLISDSFYDLSVFNIKWTIKYTFDAILYNIPIIRYMYLNITFFIITWIFTALLFLLTDLLPMSLLAFGNYFNLETFLYYLATFFYMIIYYFIEILIVIYILDNVIWFFINIS